MATDSTGRRLYNAPKNWPEIFLNHLAETSNVKASADAASVTQTLVYKKRRTDPAFAERWYAALAEGYDTLEMELLERLRTGRLEDELPDGTKRKFDIGTAFKCISAHRDTVLREKARRSLSDEVSTMTTINAKIDAMRARHEQAIALAAKRAGVTVPAAAQPKPDDGE
jgi:hypothetical protein